MGLLEALQLCDWICKNGSCTHNYKYLEIKFLNIQFVNYISRMHGAACVHFSTNIIIVIQDHSVDGLFNG